jgi:hypothetical protein
VGIFPDLRNFLNEKIANIGKTCKVYLLAKPEDVSLYRNDLLGRKIAGITHAVRGYTETISELPYPWATSDANPLL